MKHFTQNRFSKAKMVALFVFIFSMAVAFAGTVHNQGSSFRLLLPPTGQHTVVIDNIPYTGIYDRFKLDNIRQGNHRIKIVELIINRRGYVVNRMVLYNGIVFIPRNTKVWASISKHGRFIIERTYCPDNDHDRRYDNRNNKNRDYNSDRDYDNKRNDRDRKRDDYYDDDWYGSNNQNSGNRNENVGNEDDQQYSRNDNQRSDETFAITLNAIKKQSFDTERLKIAKNAVSQGNMLSREVAEITKLFSFESSRLEFAKYAYSFTTDKKNYVIVQDAFQFSSSTSELQDYITQMGNH